MLRAKLTSLLVVLSAVVADAASAASVEPPQFAPAVQYPVGDGVAMLTAADYDGNGTEDILTRDASGTLTLHRGDGRGGLVTGTSLSGPALPAAANLDADALPDLFEVASVAGDLVIRARLASGEGGFGS